MAKYYMETTITPHHSGFGMYQTGEYNGDRWNNKGALLEAIYNNVGAYYVLGEDELPDEIEDIRGNIYDEPDMVIAYFQGAEIVYGGIKEFED